MGVFFEGARAEIFVIDTSMRVQRGLKFFPPNRKSVEFVRSTILTRYRRLSSILIRKTTLSKELCDPILRQIVSKIVIFVLINRYIRKKKKDELYLKKKDL